MTQRIVLDTLIFLLSILCTAFMVKKIRAEAPVNITRQQQRQFMTTGIISFFMDTIGVGSFACNIALAKYFKTFKDETLPAMVNGAQVIPGALEAIFFLGLIQVDPLTLSVLIIGTCLGGVLGASLISKLNAQAIRLVMLMAFPGIIFLILSHHFHWLPIGGDKMALTGMELVYGFMGIFVAGALTSAGVGLFAMIQALLFCLGMSPLVAFPIMTAAGALQQPLSTGIFVYKNQVPLKKTMMISLYGIIGVLLGIPVITHLSTEKLHFLLVAVLIYNTVMMALSYTQHRETRQLEKSTSTPIGIELS